MAGQRQPTNVVIAKGAKHFTKAEIQERLEREVKPVADNIVAPDFLTKKQKQEFEHIAGQLKKLKIMGETDVDALGRYIVANEFYVNAVKQLRKPKTLSNPEAFETWSRIQERYYKQCRASANDLGLSISSRCKLVVPNIKQEEEKKNRFAAFEKKAVNTE